MGGPTLTTRTDMGMDMIGITVADAVTTTGTIRMTATTGIKRPRVVIP